MCSPSSSIGSRGLLITLSILLTALGANQAGVEAKSNEISGRQASATGWSVELSQVTTLPPPSRVLSELFVHQSPKQLVAQDNLFDDLPNELAPTLSAGPLSGSQASSNHHLFEFNRTNPWIPSRNKPAGNLLKLGLSHSPELPKPVDSLSAQLPSFITLESLTKGLTERRLAGEGTTTSSLPGNLLISRNLLQRALTIRDRLEQLEPLQTLSRQTNTVWTPQDTSEPKRFSAGLRFHNGPNSGQSTKSTRRASRPGVELFVDPFVRAKLGGGPQSELAQDDNLASYSSLPLVLSAGEARRSKAADDDDNLLAAGHHQMPVYLNSYPLKAVHIAPRHEKSMTKPILVGVAAALISFLIISNLFLSIPLLAMTLLSFFNGNLMMLPNNMNNMNNMMPPNQNNNPNSNGSNQSSNGRRRRRRALDSDLEQKIVDATEGLSF